MNAAILGDTIDLDVLSGTQDPTHKSDMYIRCHIPENLRGKVLFYKTEPVDPGISDTYHMLDSPWVVEMVGVREGLDPGFRSLNIKDGETRTQGVPEDAGLILRFHGTPEGSVALDLNTSREYTEAEAALLEEQFNTQFPRYTKWGFRIHSIIKTNGPEHRQRLFESLEQQRSRSNTEMADSITQAFMQVLQLVRAQGSAALSSEAEKILAAGTQPQAQGDSEVAKLREQAQGEYRAAQNDKVGSDAPASTLDVRSRPRK